MGQEDWSQIEVKRDVPEFSPSNFETNTYEVTLLFWVKITSLKIQVDVVDGRVMLTGLRAASVYQVKIIIVIIRNKR